ncbi:unnamed protein product [Rhodiola kirilowii]
MEQILTKELRWLEPTCICLHWLKRSPTQSMEQNTDALGEA